MNLNSKSMYEKVVENLIDESLHKHKQEFLKTKATKNYQPESGMEAAEIDMQSQADYDKDSLSLKVQQMRITHDSEDE